MTTIKTGGPAFPRPHSEGFGPPDALLEYAQVGVSLRDYYAGQALPGLIARYGCHDELSAYAFATADAMLAAREQTTRAQRGEDRA